MEYTIQNESLTVRVSDMGAELQSVRSAEGLEYLWQGDPKIWGQKAPNLFPYVGRLTGESYLFHGKTYHMSIHGFLAQSVLTAVKQEDDSITLQLCSSEKTREIYPFDFIYRIRYMLRGSTIVTTTSVKNTGTERMYFAVGGHPGFCVPIGEDAPFEEYFLEFSYPSHPNRILFSERAYPTGDEQAYPLEDGVRIRLSHDIFAHDAVVLRHMPDTVELKRKGGRHSVTLHYPDFPYLGFWQVWKDGSADVPYICIEPWSSLPSRDGIVEDLSCQGDLLRLDAGKTYENTWEIRIR